MKEALNINNLKVYGDYPKDNMPIIFVSNHTCIRDVFYILKAINKKTIVLTSSNSVYKKAPKEDFMRKYLYMLPLEIYGDSRYTNLIIEKNIDLLFKKQNIIIFPEGVYSINKNINRAHTMTSRILLGALERKIKVHLIPISIKINGVEKDKASISFDQEECTIHFLKEIKVNNLLQEYKMISAREEKNIFFHKLIDKAMLSIAKDLNVQYQKTYKSYVKKEKIVTLDGQMNDISILKTKAYYQKYKLDLEYRLNDIINNVN